ncbi:MAG: SNF2-related protein [Lachnospiraceae bacterium]
METFVPKQYQIKAMRWIIDKPYSALFMEMGLGKTVVTLTAADWLIKKGRVNRVLIVAPKKVAESTWAQEGAKWDHLQDLTFSLVLGNRYQREQALRKKADIYVINRENVLWLTEQIGRHPWPFDMVVLDELSSFKSSKSKRFRALKHYRPQMKRVVGLTGTPIGNGYMDLWAEMYLIDGGKTLGTSITKYRQEYFYSIAHYNFVEYCIKPKQGEVIKHKIQDTALCMQTKDYLELPPLTQNIEEILLSEETMEQYRELKKTYVFNTEDGADMITAANAAVLVSKLLQISSGFIYDEDHHVHQIHHEKIDRLKEIVDATNTPILVFYNFKADAEGIKKVFPKAQYLKTDADVRRWNRGEIPLLLAHPKSVGYGLNLQAGGHTIVWFDLTWSLEQYQQANARLYRMGQTHPVVINYLLCQDTVEMRMFYALKQKKVTQDALMAIAREEWETLH